MSMFFGNGGGGFADGAGVGLNSFIEAAPGEASLLLDTRFPESAWAPALRAQLVMGELKPSDWNGFKADLDKILPTKEADIASEVKALLELAQLRPARMGEILAQSDALDGPWLRLTMAAPSRPNVAALIHLGIAAGQLVGMFYKAEFARPRPVQVYPALLPAIPTPGHASFPSNHSFQSHLIAHLLAAALGPAADAGLTAPVLSALAKRIARNREIAGVHFASDSQAGEKLAALLLPKLLALPRTIRLVADARAEFGNFKVGGKPGKPGPAPVG